MRARLPAQFISFGASAFFTILCVTSAGVLRADELTLTPMEVETLQQCAFSTEALSCGASDVRKRLEGQTGSEVMGLYSRNLTEGACHTLGHIVGRHVFKRSHDVEKSMEECGYTCDGSCIHGIAGAAFLEALDIEPVKAEEMHIDSELIHLEGRSLCATSRAVCHGIGHMLYLLHNSFREPLRTCDEIASGWSREDCYRGVFMEHADIISTNDFILGKSRSVELKEDDILYPCDSVTDRYLNACYRYQPRIQNRIFADSGVTDAKQRDALRREACEALSAAYGRSDCFEGIGRSLFEDALVDPQPVVEWCNNLPRVKDRAACYFGVARPIASYNRRKEALMFCAKVPGFYENATCYYASISAILRNLALGDTMSKE